MFREKSEHIPALSIYSIYLVKSTELILSIVSMVACSLGPYSTMKPDLSPGR